MADPLLLAVLALAAGGPPSPSREILPFIRDDYPRAVAEARSRKLPLFIEAWAPW